MLINHNKGSRGNLTAWTKKTRVSVTCFIFACHAHCDYSVLTNRRHVDHNLRLLLDRASSNRTLHLANATFTQDYFVSLDRPQKTVPGAEQTLGTSETRENHELTNIDTHHVIDICWSEFMDTTYLVGKVDNENYRSRTSQPPLLSNQNR